MGQFELPKQAQFCHFFGQSLSNIDFVNGKIDYFLSIFMSMFRSLFWSMFGSFLNYVGLLGHLLRMFWLSCRTACLSKPALLLKTLGSNMSQLGSIHGSLLRNLRYQGNLHKRDSLDPQHCLSHGYMLEQVRKADLACFPGLIVSSSCLLVSLSTHVFLVVIIYGLPLSLFLSL